MAFEEKYDKVSPSFTGGGGGGVTHLEMLECNSPRGRFIDSISGRINDESLVFSPIIFVDAFHPMVVPNVQAKLSS